VQWSGTARECSPHTARTWSRWRSFASSSDPRLRESRSGERLTLWRVAYTVIIDEIRRYSRQQRQAEELARANRNTWAGGALGDPRLPRRPSGKATNRSHLASAGFRVGEVAGALGWTEKQAENLVYRGLADLRICLEGESRPSRRTSWRDASGPRFR
jgi:hypothetical protein